MTNSARAALRMASLSLAEAGIDSAGLDARLLLGEALGIEPVQLLAHPERVVTAAEASLFQTLVARRARRQPLAQILGRREFWSLEFRVTADTLAPRPDSETVVETALAEIADRAAPLRLLDLGTGTGCLLLSLLHELPQASGIGVDFSAAALAVACANAASLGLADRAAFRRARWGEGLDERFDLIVSNPPYIPSAEIDQLMPEVARYEPRMALDGGVDGLDAYRAIATDVGRLLSPRGRMAVEIGATQADSAGAILAAAGLAVTAVRRDLAGHPRCLILRWNC